MDSRRSTETGRDGRKKRHSPAWDSEEERRRRRRKDREGDRERGTRSDRHEDGWRDKYDRKERRSCSPASSSRRRRDDHDSTHGGDSSRRKHDDQEPKHRIRDRSPSYRGNKDREQRSSREDSATQLSRKSKGPLPSQNASFMANKDPSMALVEAGDQDMPDKLKPSLAPTGLLAAASNSVERADGTAIALKYHEPAEARKPPAKDVWKLFVFKAADILETIELSARSCWLVGREISVVDMAAEHPSISKQHAVIQFRYIDKTNEFGDKLGRVRPYLIDLESANGTSLNKEEIPPSRYLELRDKDMIQLGHSTREYVLMLSPKG